MTAIRHMLAQRLLCAFLCAATLWLKLLVPTGYMIANQSGHVAIEICSGMAAQHTTKAMADMMPDMPGEASGHGKSQDHGKAEQPCAFSGLSAAALHAVDPIQLAALVAFVTAMVLTPTALPGLASGAYLRPPLRGPPANL